ncbi:MAG: protein tyrosine phosphatase family protein [Pseudomonadota bacterium]
MSELTHVLNWRRLNDRITLSGQPTEEQLAELADTGVTHIINLGPHSNNGALPDEPGTVLDLGMEYIYIPVDFEAPTDDDFGQFCSALENLPTQRIHVHCIYNARVTAFFYRHAKSGLSPLDTDTAFEIMDGIWRPGDDWAEFIGDDSAKDQPNRFKGYEY